MSKAKSKEVKKQPKPVLKKNDFVTFKRGYGIVSIVTKNYAEIVWHNGMKISSLVTEVDSCIKITKQQFLDLIERSGDTLWYSSKDNIKVFHGVTF